MTVRTIQEILTAAGKQQPVESALGANDIVIAAAILAQAIDRHADTVATAIKHTAEKPK